MFRVFEVLGKLPYTFMLKENQKDIPILPLDLALWLTLTSLCLEHVFTVPKVFEPLKFDCILYIYIIYRISLAVFKDWNTSEAWKTPSLDFV